MAWGAAGMVFLGEDLMHSRDYSDETQHVIDEETERILREQEERATKVLRQHRDGLDAVAAALLAKETIDGAEVGRLVDGAFGRPVHAPGVKDIPRFGATEPTDAGPLDDDTVAVPAPPDGGAGGGAGAGAGAGPRPVGVARDPDRTEVLDR
jgi:hypothetical protein